MNSDRCIWFLVPESEDFRTLFCFVLSSLFYSVQPVEPPEPFLVQEEFGKIFQ